MIVTFFYRHGRTVYRAQIRRETAVAWCARHGFELVRVVEVSPV